MSAPLATWLAILQAGQPGATVWQAVWDHYRDVEAIRQADPQTLARLGLTAATVRRLKAPDTACTDTWQQWLDQPDHRLLTRTDPHWPRQFANEAGAPLALWLRGTRPELLQTPQLAIVGARSATAGGMANAQAFAHALGQSGLTITSGLAIGIDAAAHRGALATDSGTIAVLGNGIDRIYPHENTALARQIAGNGVIVSEYPPGTAPQRYFFPARNRLIAALALGVLVVEAGPRSGSLITARLAGERGREIFAIPGSIHNPLARGCHRLIRDGATLVETADDVVRELAPTLRAELDLRAPERPPVAESADSMRHNVPDDTAQPAAEYRNLLAAIGFDPVNIGEIVARTTLTTAEVSSMLLLLELEGHVEALPGGRYMRTPEKRRQ